MDAPVSIAPRVVRKLVEEQFPELASLALSRIPSGGTDNAVFKLGDLYAVRLPLYAGVADQLARELEWLPVLAPLLPLAIPEPVVLGEPADGYPWPWAIYRWLPGETVTGHRIASEIDDVIPLAGFVAALHRLNIRDGPAAGPTNGFRGGPLRMRDAPPAERLTGHRASWTPLR